MGSALCNASYNIWKTGKHHNTLTPSSLVGGWQHFTGSTGSTFRADTHLSVLSKDKVIIIYVLHVCASQNILHLHGKPTNAHL
jgi:hypothetical protein